MSDTLSLQVLSLNLTNLVILIVLKALILAAGFFGAGAWKGGHQYGRSLEGEALKMYKIVTVTHIWQLHCFVRCLYRVLCIRVVSVGMWN